MAEFRFSCVDGLLQGGFSGGHSWPPVAVTVAEELVACGGSVGVVGRDFGPGSDASSWSCDGLVLTSNADSACGGFRAAFAREGDNSCKGRGDPGPSTHGKGAGSSSDMVARQGFSAPSSSVDDWLKGIAGRRCRIGFRLSVVRSLRFCFGKS